MAETKRVSDQYKISAPSIVIDGNLTVTGSTTSVETVNSVILDNIIVLNQNEVGAGVTVGSAGIEIERGSETNTTFTFNENYDAWEAKIGSSYTTVRGATPVDDNDLATKDYVDAGIGSSLPGGPLTSIQYNNGSSFGGNANLYWDGSNLVSQDVFIGTGSISVGTSNSDLEIAANGTGKIYLRNVLRLENEASNPISETSSNVIFAKTPGNAGSGLYFTNDTATDEFVSRSKAILFGLIF
jgi:hypothetical protein